MVLSFEKAFACFLFHLPHSPSVDLKFGAKFSHDNAMTDSLGISVMLSSTPRSSQQHYPSYILRFPKLLSRAEDFLVPLFNNSSLFLNYL